MKKRVIHNRKKKFSMWLNLIPIEVLSYITNYHITDNYVFFEIGFHNLGYSKNYLITKNKTVNNINPFPYTISGNNFPIEVNSEEECKQYLLNSIN
jgi:hypothetical protein